MIGPDPFVGLDRSTIRQYLSEEANIRILDWERTPDSRQSKSLLGCYYLKGFMQMLKLSRKLVRILIELLIGNCRLRSYLSKLEIES